MKRITLFALTCMIISACLSNEKPPIVYGESDKAQTEEEQDSFSMQVMDLPIQLY